MGDEVEQQLDDLARDIGSDYGDYEGQFSKLDMKHHLPGTGKQSWQKCSELAEKYDKGICDAYREQIDTLLVFAGLFSAVVTSFAAESYHWLHNDSGDVSVQLLAQIASMLNGTGPPAPAPATSALSNAVAVRINTYWFLSLILALSAALVGILAKQWIREYDRDVGRTHPESLGVRQMKFDGLEAWKVNEIVSSVPLLLQFALGLFFLGIVELLWQLHPAVAVPVTTVVILALVFYVVTTILPTVHLANWYRTPGSRASQCPYKSPHAWIVLRAALRFIMDSVPAKNQKRHFRLDSERFERADRSIRNPRSWVALDIAWTALSDAETALDRPEYRFRALGWLSRSVDHADLPSFIWHCLRQPRLLVDFSHRFRANLLCCIPGVDGAAVAYQDIPCMGKLDPVEQSNLLYLAYAHTASLPEITVVELFFGFFLQSFRKFNEQDYHWFTVHCFWLPGRLPEKLFIALFRAVREITQSNALVASPMLGLLNWFITYWEPESRHRTRLILAICELARRWLDAAGDYGHIEDEVRNFRIERCRGILMSTINALPTSEAVVDSIERGPPYSTTTLVLAQLARDMDRCGRYLRSRGVDAMSSWLSVEQVRMRRLVAIAASHDTGENVVAHRATYASSRADFTDISAWPAFAPTLGAGVSASTPVAFTSDPHPEWLRASSGAAKSPGPAPPHLSYVSQSSGGTRPGTYFMLWQPFNGWIGPNSSPVGGAAFEAEPPGEHPDGAPPTHSVPHVDLAEEHSALTPRDEPEDQDRMEMGVERMPLPLRVSPTGDTDTHARALPPPGETEPPGAGPGTSSENWDGPQDR